MGKLQENIVADMHHFMKTRNVESRDILKLIICEMQRQPNKSVEDHTVVKILNTMIKYEKENLNREGLDTSDYLELLEDYVPSKVNEQEIIDWIEENINFSQFKNKMQAMKPIMAHFGTSADGNAVKQIINNI